MKEPTLTGAEARDSTKCLSLDFGEKALIALTHWSAGFTTLTIHNLTPKELDLIIKACRDLKTFLREKTP